MPRRLFQGRRLESSFAIASALLVVFVVGAALAVVRGRLENVLRQGMQARGYSVAQSIGAVSTPLRQKQQAEAGSTLPTTP